MHKSVKVVREHGTAEFSLRGSRVTVFAYPHGTEVPSRTLSRPAPASARALLLLADEALAPRRG